MPGAHGKAFTSDHVVHRNGSVDFTCSQDGKAWPWTRIGPHHPAAIQAASYWLGVECAAARGLRDPRKWSALTSSQWNCGAVGVGRVARGRYEPKCIEGKEGATVHLYDDAGRPICQIEKRWVVFRTRNFENWRSSAKQAGGHVSSAGFYYADRNRLGLSDKDLPFLGPLSDGKATGLLDPANSMPPAHPWLDGSGDHVNSAHLAEIARQFVSLLRGGEPFRVTAGAMRFDHYVELSVPFEIERIGRDPGVETMQLRQSGRACTWAEYQVE